MKKKSNLPTGLTRQKNGNVSVQLRIYYHQTAKFAPFSAGTYKTVKQAQKAKDIVIELTGTTQESKKRVRESKIREDLNKYRASINLKLLKKRI
jgi:hypothetical protein